MKGKIDFVPNLDLMKTKIVPNNELSMHLKMSFWISGNNQQRIFKDSLRKKRGEIFMDLNNRIIAPIQKR